MERSKDTRKNGVIVGRFQVDELTDGHRDLIERVAAAHERVLIVLGLSPCKCSYNNPLDYQARRQMINETFPNVEVLYISDVSSDLVWSDTLDVLLGEKAKCSTEDTCLYGSRDSFIQYYCGKYPTRVLEQTSFTSGTARRKQLASIKDKNVDFRRGAIWAIGNQWPAAIPTVDVAIISKDHSQILLGRKEKESLYRFIGGFVEPGETLEQTAVREVREEANIESAPRYVTSHVVDDWRYRSERNKITTSLFVCDTWTPLHVIAPGDDIHELRWFPFNAYTIDSMVKEHIDLYRKLIVWVDRKLR